MTFKEVINFVDWAGLFVYHIPWLFSAACLLAHNVARVQLKDQALKILRFVYHEGKPFYFVYVGVDVLDLAMSDNLSSFLALFTVGANILNWHLYKDVDKDDDRWKRRKQKLKEKVTVTEGKLAVVPAGS